MARRQPARCCLRTVQNGGPMIGKTVSHFRIESELGKGGMGVVYKARDTKLDIDRALKFLNPDMLGQKALVDRFLTEARTLAAVQHPNICPIQEIGEEDGQVFIAMSYLEGKTLQEVLRGGPLSPYRAVQIIKEVVSGLQKAHAGVHRARGPGSGVRGKEVPCTDILCSVTYIWKLSRLV